MKKYTLPLNGTKAPLFLAGGKGHNLTRLIGSGFTVPSGFIISTEAYLFFIEKNKLASSIRSLCQLGESADAMELERIAKDIRRLITEATIPTVIAREIADNYQKWQAKLPGDDKRENCPVAVRSSANAEDSPGFSFAGLHDSYLNIKGEAHLLAAVKNCWASLWNTRAIAYRNHSRIDATQIAMAVVVQHFVFAEKSGILFTANPLTSDPDEIMINAVWGLGESAVGGKSMPDTLVLDKKTQETTMVKIAHKTAMTVTSENGTTEVPVKAVYQNLPVLDPEELTRLATIATSIEAHFGCPQDIEWAIAGEKAYILQSRPITQMADGQEKNQATKGSVPGDDKWPVVGKWTAQPFDEWTRANVGELWRDPVSPLVASTVPLIISGAVSHSFYGIEPKFLNQIQWAKRFLGRIYYNEGALRHLLSKKLGLPASIMDKGRGNIRKSNTIENNRLHIVRILLHLPILTRLARRQFITGKDLSKFITDVDEWSATFRTSVDFHEDDKQLWGRAMLWLERTKYALKLQNDMSGFAVTAFATLEQLTDRWLGDKELSLELVSGIPGVQAAKIGHSLWEMAKKIQTLGFADEVLHQEPLTALEHLQKAESAKPILLLLDEFLIEHGHRCPNEAEWLYPRWADEPEQVINLIKGYLDRLDSIEMIENQVQQRQKEAFSKMNEKLNWAQRKIMKFVLRRAQHGVLLRDNGKSYAIKASYPARKISSILGQRWSKRGWLKEEEDIYFLTMVEIQQVINSETDIDPDFNFYALVSERRKAFQYWFTINAPSSLDANGQAFVDDVVEEGFTSLQGIAASKGRVRGRARIIFSPYEALKMKPGEILITRATDAGWSAIFPVITGLVTEIGGQLSHAAILAREYRLPAVVNVPNVTAKLQDGQMITIDGGTGEIIL